MPTLFSVSGERLELEPDRVYTLGRALDCDVIVEDMAASRHHTRITVGHNPEALLLEDLKSRNGTFVNEERVDGRVPLLDRARVRVGATVFLLRMSQDGTSTATANMDTGTIGLEHLSFGADVDPQLLKVAAGNGRGHTEIAGQLSSFTMIDVLQLLIQTHRTGTLHVALGEQAAEVHLKDGEVLHAVLGELEGFEALRALVQRQDGIFWLVETIPLVKRTVRDASSILLFELCQAIDEGTPAGF